MASAAPTTSSSPVVGKNDDPSPPPLTKRRRTNEPIHDVPSSVRYQTSYSHRSVVTTVRYAPRHDFVLTASDDGVVKFWRRNPSSYGNEVLEFVRSYRAHVGRVLDLAISHDGGDHAASVGADGRIQFYDVASFDVAATVVVDKEHRLSRTFSCASFVGREDRLLAVSSGSSVRLFDRAAAAPSPVRTLSTHAARVTAIAYSRARNVAVSVDADGGVEVWDCSDDHDSGGVTAAEPTAARNGISYASRYDDTDLYVFRKTNKKKRSRAPARAVAIAACDDRFALYGSDRRIRLFDFATLRVVATYDERAKIYDDPARRRGVDAMDHGRRAATEREIDDSPLVNPDRVRDDDDDDEDAPPPQRMGLAFDGPSGRRLLVPTMLGVKVIDTTTHACVRIVGREDAAARRFVDLALCVGRPRVDQQTELARAAAESSGRSSRAMSSTTSKDGRRGGTDDDGTLRSSDPILVATAYRQPRLYVLSNVDPGAVVSSNDDDGGGGDQKNDVDPLLSRDVLNEPLDPSSSGLADDGPSGPGSSSHPSSSSANKNTTTSEAVLRTTLGDIRLRLFGAATPRTVENFRTHAENGYYDDVVFHRVIKGFMVQTGDPLGNGTGGESIWGGEFEDEFVRDLRFDRPFTVAMANAGPGTNGSQFFITTVPTPWLDNKHTVFGRVVAGMDVCSAIENVKVDDADKPLDEVRIVSIDLE